jgi:glucan 1,3-beta-glucosidase
MGTPGTRGLIEVSDILFDVAEVLPGAILVENNVSGFEQGSVGIWDTHFKIGGTEDSSVEVQCPSYPPEGTYNVTSCKAAFMLLHLHPESSTYIESMWGWTVNRDLDGLTGSTNGTSQAIAVGRGLLVESQKSTWLVGTAFEHCTLYQYQLANAENVYMLMAQTETVYWQPGPPASAPFVYDASPST